MTGGLFLAAMFVAPLAEIVPTEVYAAALVIVGAMMFSQLRHVDISEFSVALPVVLTVATMPFSYSIAKWHRGRLRVTWVVRSAAGKGREISPLLWIVAGSWCTARSWIQSMASVNSAHVIIRERFRFGLHLRVWCSFVGRTQVSQTATPLGRCRWGVCGGFSSPPLASGAVCAQQGGRPWCAVRVSRRFT